MEYIFKQRHTSIPDESLLRDLAETANNLGKAGLTIKEYNSGGKYNAITLIKRFGSWTSTLEKAGLKIQKILGPVNKTDLLSNLKNVWDKLGRQPTQRHLTKPLSDYSVSTYKRSFGTWYNAIDALINYIRENGDTVKFSKAREEVKKTRPVKHRQVPKSLRYDILKRDGFRCQGCGKSPASQPGVVLHVDHIIPLSKGGTNDPDNLVTLCGDCNIGKAAKLITALAQKINGKWLIENGKDAISPLTYLKTILLRASVENPPFEGAGRRGKLTTHS